MQNGIQRNDRRNHSRELLAHIQRNGDHESRLTIRLERQGIAAKFHRTQLWRLHAGNKCALQSLADDKGCRVVIADDGVGLPEGAEWPKRGKLSALIAQSLRENAKASLEVKSSPGCGTRVTIVFTRAAAAPGA